MGTARYTRFGGLFPHLLRLRMVKASITFSFLLLLTLWKAWPYPEAIFNSSRSMQKLDGLWGHSTNPSYIDLDGWSAQSAFLAFFH